MKKSTTIIVAYVNNKPGVLSRITSLIRRRQFNIETITAGYTEKENVTQITLLVDAKKTNIEQLKKQLFKLIDVLKIIELSPESAFLREVALFKIAPPSKNHLPKLKELVKQTGAKVSHIDHKSLTIELCSDPLKIDRFAESLQPFGVKKLTRGGLTVFKQD